VCHPSAYNPNRIDDLPEVLNIDWHGPGRMIRGDDGTEKAGNSEAAIKGSVWGRTLG
jgi:hypothetical protein